MAAQRTPSQADGRNGDEDSKRRIWKIVKYVYVIGIFVFAFIILVLQQLWDSFDSWLDKTEILIIDFFIDNNIIYIILIIIFITILKGLGIKDPLSLRNISVIILSYKIIPNSKFLSFCLSMLIMGALSSFSKILEYMFIGHELQIVQGTPIKYIFKYIRKLLILCINNTEKIKWFDPKYIFDISTISRNDKTMDVYSNFHAVITRSKCQSNDDDTDNDDDDDEEAKPNKNIVNIICDIFIFLIVVIWTSVVEWIQPITELFLYAHCWKLSIRNVIIIILSEIADFDKAVEVWYITKSLYQSGGVIDGKIAGIFWKPAFWAIGYLIIMPLTLLWAYSYYNNYLNLDDLSISIHDDQNQEMMPPPLDRTATPLLMDNDQYDHNTPNNNNNNNNNDNWKRFKYIHNQHHPTNNQTESELTVDYGDYRTNSTAL